MLEHGLNQQQLADLASFDTPTVCNAIELFDVRPRNIGFMNESIKACFPKMPPMVGYALTSTFRSASPPRDGDVYASMSKQVEAYESLPGPPIVTFQDLDEPVLSATFGEVMCTTYQAFGAKGLITSGAGRDLDQVEAIGFPTFTNGAICAHGYCHILSVGVPVSVGGITVYQGDLLHGDLNGVTTVPHEIAGQIADACRELMAAEDIVLNYVRGENITPDGLNEARVECAAVMKKLSEKLQA
ncbi:MAG: RraA family protein [Planctomycetaceae bacterium]|jgi:4-hydroxy-4-methyl-2-oxoglutarate aldolase|nr:RraA family protein [bacterium]MDB4679754.1 RraA family protein [Planctomycetaceae bacterium]MDB4786953.1 RraA family protein [Planctomycetaceae bacterium]MDC0273209.1 RraA family protein [Planctomycetaceae bacterium]MDG2389363.1 RraA family protein [Planctomycetaceae bacterium]